MKPRTREKRAYSCDVRCPRSHQHMYQADGHCPKHRSSSQILCFQRLDQCLAYQHPETVAIVLEPRTIGSVLKFSMAVKEFVGLNVLHGQQFHQQVLTPWFNICRLVCTRRIYRLSVLTGVSRAVVFAGYGRKKYVITCTRINHKSVDVRYVCSM